MHIFTRLDRVAASTPNIRAVNTVATSDPAAPAAASRKC